MIKTTTVIPCKYVHKGELVLKKRHYAFHKSQRAIRLHSCESNFIIFAPSYVNSSRQNRFKCCNLPDLIYSFLDNGVMTTPKCRFLSFDFTVLCFKKSLLIWMMYKFVVNDSEPDWKNRCIERGLLWFVHSHGQKGEIKHTTESFVEFHSHSPL